VDRRPDLIDEGALTREQLDLLGEAMDEERRRRQ
jgi:hypothetical protein